MPNRRSLLSLTLSCMAVLPCYGQTPLAQSFADMKSKDPQVADEARKHAAKPLGGIEWSQEESAKSGIDGSALGSLYSTSGDDDR